MSFHITPAAGCRVRDASGQVLGPQGITVASLSTYWKRRRNDREIVVTEIAEAPAASSDTAEHQ